MRTALVYLGLFLLLSGGFVLGGWGILLGAACVLLGWALAPLSALGNALLPTRKRRL